MFPSPSGAPGAGAPAFLSTVSRALHGLSLRLAELPWWAWLIVLGLVVAVLLLRLQRSDEAAAGADGASESGQAPAEPETDPTTGG